MLTERANLTSLIRQVDQRRQQIFPLSIIVLVPLPQCLSVACQFTRIAWHTTLNNGETTMTQDPKAEQVTDETQSEQLTEVSEPEKAAPIPQGKLLLNLREDKRPRPPLPPIPG